MKNFKETSKKCCVLWVKLSGNFLGESSAKFIKTYLVKFNEILKGGFDAPSPKKKLYSILT